MERGKQISARRGAYVVVALAVVFSTVQTWAEDIGDGGRFFDYKGHKVFYVERGQGQPMIFLHNGGTSHRIWDNQVQKFGQKYHVYALDHLGFGKSDKPDIDYPLEIHIGQVKAFIDYIGAKRVVLVGHCMGGAMALNYTARHPETVDRLILCNVYTEQTLLAGSLAEMYRRLSSDPAALAQAVERAQKAPPRGGYSEDSRANVTLIRGIARADSYGISDRLKLPEGMPPMLLIWGEQNPVLPLGAGKVLCDQIQPQDFKPLEGCQHMAMLEDPEAFNAAMQSFLARSCGQR